MNTDEYDSDYLAQLGASRLIELRRLLEDHFQQRANYQLQLSEAKDVLESSGKPSDSPLARIIAKCEDSLRKTDANAVELRRMVERYENFLLNLPRPEQ